MQVTQAYRFCLDPTPSQERRLASHAGAARFAYNWGLRYVKACLEAREWERRIAGAPLTEAPWSLPALRREWNAQKDRIAPWWEENSKEAYNAGLAALADGLRSFSASRAGRRKGRRMGFPRRRRRRRQREGFRYTTGSFGPSARTRVKLPRIGHVRTHEPTTKLTRKIEAGKARVRSATIRRERGRWHCSFTCEVEREEQAPRRSDAVVGVDAGVHHLAVLSTGEQVENPRALERAQRKLRRLQRKADRQRRARNPDCFDEAGRAIRGKRALGCSQRQERTEREIRRLHARAAAVRRDAMHKLTTRLAATYGTVVCEKLNAAGLCRGGNRGLRRAIHDASLAELRRQLTYKCAWRGGELIEASTSFRSSKTCSGCGAAKAKLPLGARTYRCERCGLVVDRDENAARNLAALATVVVASGAETENARSPTQVGPSLARRRVDREAGRAEARETGAAFEQSEAA